MIILIAEKGYGPISEDQVTELTGNYSIIHCKRCSDIYPVYHNTLGKHFHIKASEIVKKFTPEAFTEYNL
jgi:hypothetical protein